MGKLVKQKSIKILEILIDQVDIELYHIPFDLSCQIEDTGLIIRRPDRSGQLRIYPRDSDNLVVESTISLDRKVMEFGVKTIADRTVFSQWVVNHFTDRR